MPCQSSWGWICCLCVLLAFGAWGCDQGERFKVPVRHDKIKSFSANLYQAKGKVKLPRNRSLPSWTELVDFSESSFFRSEVVQLKGKRWSREGSGKVFEFYFQRDNHMAARTLSQVGNRLAFFVSRWFGKPFKGRIPVVLMPTDIPKARPAPQARSVPRKAARRVAPRPIPRKAARRAPAAQARQAPRGARPAPRKAAPRAAPRPVPRKALRAPAPRVSPRPVAPRTRPVAPAARPAAKARGPVKAASRPTTASSQPSARRQTKAASRPVARRSVARRPVVRQAQRPRPAPGVVRAPRPAARGQAGPRPALARRPAPARRAQLGKGPTPARRAKASKAPLEIPDVGSPRIVIYTGTTHNPVYSRYGLICELLGQSVRIMMTGSAKKRSQQLWRSVLVPAYFEFRGNGAMGDRSFNKTATPTFRRFLERAGRPQVSELWSLLGSLRSGGLPSPLRSQTEQLALSFLGFVEDAYGHGVFAGLIRHLTENPKQSIEQSAHAVVGRRWKGLWRQWFGYYYADQWRKVLSGQAPLSTIPKPR